MRITKTQLKQRIREELEVILTNEEVEEIFGEEIRNQIEEDEQFRDQQKSDRAPHKQEKQIKFEEWARLVAELGFEFTEDPEQNPYDAWFTGVSPEEYVDNKPDERGEM